MLVELDLSLMQLYFSRKLFVVKNNVEMLFFSENRLQNRGAHCTRVNMVVFESCTPYHCYIYNLIYYTLQFILVGWVLIDRCGKHFGTILNFLRDGSVVLPESQVELRQLMVESKYYLIEPLAQQCENALAKKQENCDPICKVPLITSTKEERMLISSSHKVHVTSKCSVLPRTFKQSGPLGLKYLPLGLKTCCLA